MGLTTLEDLPPLARQLPGVEKLEGELMAAARSAARTRAAFRRLSRLLIWKSRIRQRAAACHSTAWSATSGS
jgi:hypothetical protein